MRPILLSSSRQFLVEHEERQGEHDGRQDQLRQEEERDVLVAPGPEPVLEPRQAIGRERAHDDGEQRPAERCNDAVAEALKELVANSRNSADRVGRQAERAPAFPIRMEVVPRHEMALGNVDGRLKRGRDGPIDREQADEGPKQQCGVDEGPRRDAPQPSARVTFVRCRGRRKRDGQTGSFIFEVEAGRIHAVSQ